MKHRVDNKGKNGVEKRHSQTAVMTALYRAIAYHEFQDNRLGTDNRLGPDDLAVRFLPLHFRFLTRFKFFRAKGIQKSDALTPGVYAYTLARTAFFDSVFETALKEGVAQIFILGAGYDTRGIRFRKVLHQTRVFELDVPTTQARKLACLKKAGLGVPHQLSFVPINFNKASLRKVLARAGADFSLRTLCVWEGVSYYLEPEAVGATLAFVGGLEHPGNRIAFDYGVTLTPENMAQYYGVKEFMEIWKKHRSGEPFRFLIDEAALGPFLEQHRLAATEHLDKAQIEKRFLRDLGEKSPGPILGSLRFVVAEPLARQAFTGAQS